MENQRAFNLIEVLTVLAVVGLMATLALPALQAGLLSSEIRLAAGEVAASLYKARIYAVRQSANVALAFEERGGEVYWTLYRDGDGDGVRRQDIERGIDKPVEGDGRLAHFGQQVRLGFPQGMIPSEIGNPRQRIQNLDDPIKFNGSDMASFSSLGTATPGTVYIRGGDSHLMAVRVTSLSGKVTLWQYDAERALWHRRG